MARKKRPDFNQVEWARRASYPHSREECRDCVHYGMRPPVCNSLERHFLRLPEEADETQECPFREEETADILPSFTGTVPRMLLFQPEPSHVYQPFSGGAVHAGRVRNIAGMSFSGSHVDGTACGFGGLVTLTVCRI